jgi:DNA processing protein
MEYLWLSIYVKLDYLTYINLLQIFKNVRDLYVISEDKNKFLRVLRSNGIYINYKIFSNLVNSSLKLKSIELFQNLYENNIKIINIHSKYYPKSLINIFNPPLVLFAYGKLSLLKEKIIYVYNSTNFSSNGKKVYNEFCEYMIQNGISILSDNATEYSNVIYLPYLKKLDRENILVISDTLEKNSNINYEYIAGVSDFLFIPEASYNIKVATIVDLILEQGKDIFVVPR